MIKKFTAILILSLMCNSQHLFAQLDSNNGGKDKGKTTSIKLKNAKVTKKPTGIELKGNAGFKKAFDKEEKKRKQEQKEKELENKEILTPNLIRKIKFNKFIEKNTLQVPMIDKDIGSFRTTSHNINLLHFDFGRIDGDVVTVLKNGKPYLENIKLLSIGENEVVKIPLDMGFNKIEIIAISEGRLRPNTGAFRLFDDYRKEVFSDTWSLAKGAKVIAHIIRY